LKIGGHDLDKDVLIVAEIGNNHEGSIGLAEEMVGLAARAGADVVKFQTIVPDRLVSPMQIERLQQLERFSLSYDEFEKLSKIAAREGVQFMSTPFDIESAHFLAPFVPAFKIASGDNSFYPLIDAVARMGKPILLSTGLADLNQLKKTVASVEQSWQSEGIQQEIALLHCVVEYPTPPEHAALSRLSALASLSRTIGYSDHTRGIDAAPLAVALGARIIEKHFTIANDYSAYRDHQLSADPEAFTRLVETVRQAERMLLRDEGALRDTEKEVAAQVRRSIAARCDLEKGHLLAWIDLTWVRPADGLPPGSEDQLVGCHLIRALSKGESILPEDVE
jgi:sialic acid synthase SpsE